MKLNESVRAALLWATGLAQERGGAVKALTDAGVNLGSIASIGDQLELSLEHGWEFGPVEIETLALGILAGRVVPGRPRFRRFNDPTMFLMDEELVCRDAKGESILRLPWFDDGLFVGRQLPDIAEMPRPVRRLAVDNYSAALKGNREHFSFTSYGHSYSVDAFPVRGERGHVESVLAVARPAPAFISAARTCETTAERLEASATLAEERAVRYRAAGREAAALAEWRRAEHTRSLAERARMNAHQLRLRGSATPADPPSVTARETEILELASHGLRSGEIAEQLSVSQTTVKSHFDNIYAKLGVGDRTAAVALAIRHGLIS
jgi:DNA-binding CsgD family transcriptional regulator